MVSRTCTSSSRQAAGSSSSTQRTSASSRRRAAAGRGRLGRSELLGLERGAGAIAQGQRLEGGRSQCRRGPVVAVEHAPEHVGELGVFGACLLGGGALRRGRTRCGRRGRGGARSGRGPSRRRTSGRHGTPTTQGSTRRSAGAPWVPRYVKRTERPATTASSSGGEHRQRLDRAARGAAQQVRIRVVAETQQLRTHPSGRSPGGRGIPGAARAASSTVYSSVERSSTAPLVAVSIR